MARLSKDRPPLLEGSRLALLGAAVFAGLCALPWFTERTDPVVCGVLYVCLMSVFTFALFAWDKRRAIEQRRRISEANLMWAAWLGGAGGGWFAMQRLRHKSQHKAFQILLPLAFLLQLAALAYLAISGRMT